MIDYTLADLQASVQDRSAFNNLTDYVTLCQAFLVLIESRRPTRIISPSHRNYIFYQYDETYGHKITRPLNSELFIESAHDFQVVFERFFDFLDDIKQYHDSIVDNQSGKSYIETREINKLFILSSRPSAVLVTPSKIPIRQESVSVNSLKD